MQLEHTVLGFVVAVCSCCGHSMSAHNIHIVLVEIFFCC